MNSSCFKIIRNCQAVHINDIPEVNMDAFREGIIGEVKKDARICAYFGVPRTTGGISLFAVLAHDTKGKLAVISTSVSGSYPSLTPECTQAHWFEREIYEQWGVIPEAHPWLKPIRFHKNYIDKADDQKNPVIGIADFFKLEGHEVHEVAVGPVHAGIIEPGHFRFQCHGENVYNLEISLGYQHRGIEAALIGGPAKRAVHYMETAAGDTTIGHATAYAGAIEALAANNPPPRAATIRGIALELERLANHTGDLGALAQDVGYLPTSSYCGRIRGDFLNMSALLCGSRFGRGLVRPGGVLFDLDTGIINQLKNRLAKALKDLNGAVNLLWETPSVMGRFENTGKILPEDSIALGLVGVPARACGIMRDIRFDFPSGIFNFTQLPVSTWDTGDVFARAYVRWLEIQRSLAFIQSQLDLIPKGAVIAKCGFLSPETFVVSMIEGWRGEICHAALTDKEGRFSRYKIIDPSFHNWMGLAISLRNQQISDFPLCNKSFNLSYCGHDL